MSRDPVIERVPVYLARVGDHVVAGSNNSSLILGRDRPAGPESGLGSTTSPGGGKGAGSAHLVAGMAGQDPSFKDDSAFVYLSAKTEADKNLGTGGADGDSGKGAAAIMRSDDVRVSARRDVKVVIDGNDSFIHLTADSCFIQVGSSTFRMSPGKVVVDADVIELGEGAAQGLQRLIKGDDFMNLVFNTHTHTCAVGPTSPPNVPMTEVALSQRKAFVR